MPIDTQHKSYTTNLPIWQRCRDVISGQEAVHKAGTKYLPSLKDQSTEDYKAYVARALFFNATQRTAEALVGMVFRKNPVVEHPAGMKPIIEDVTLENVPFNAFAQSVMQEVIDVGRVGVLVDYPRVTPGSAPRTVAEAEAVNNRPFATIYKAEKIVNWRCERIRNEMRLTLVVLMETKLVRKDDYTDEEEPRLRALILRNGVYVQEVWKKKVQNTQTFAAKPEEGKSPNWEIEEEVTPTVNGQPLDFIPFLIVSPDDMGADVEKPPLLDMVDVNLSHYRTTADYEHGAHFCGLPTPVISGYTPATNEKLYVGSAAAWVFTSPEARAYYLEFGGQGLATLSTLRGEKVEYMAALGARMLAPDTKGVEAATTAAIHRAGEISVLAKIANTVSRSLKKVLEWLGMWSGTAGEIKVELSTDYFPMPMDSAMLTALVSSWQQGAISKETLFTNLKRGEIIADSVTFEEEDAKIGDEPPAIANQLNIADANAQNQMTAAEHAASLQSKDKAKPGAKK